MTGFDILILGGGMAGAGLGAALAARGHGARLLLAEAEDSFGYHATGRSAAFWLESYGGPAVAPLTRASRAPLEAGGWLRPRGALHLSRAAATPGALDRQALDALLPGLRPEWRSAISEPGCCDIDVAGFHADRLAACARGGAQRWTGARMVAARHDGAQWDVAFADGRRAQARLLVNAAGAWADTVASAAGAAPLGLAPLRRTMVQLRLGRGGLAGLPLVLDSAGQFYFKGAGETRIWLSPHDETPSAPVDSAAEEYDVAAAIARFEAVVDWPVEAVERKWAGLRTFAPDRLPVYGFDRVQPALFWAAGQGGFGIQTAPAASDLAAALLLGQEGALDPAPFSPARLG